MVKHAMKMAVHSIQRIHVLAAPPLRLPYFTCVFTDQIKLFLFPAHPKRSRSKEISHHLWSRTRSESLFFPCQLDKMQRVHSHSWRTRHLHFGTRQWNSKVMISVPEIWQSSSEWYINEGRDYSSASPQFKLALTASIMAKILDGRAKDVLKRRTVELALMRR